jgi:hypothetical protein
MNDEPMYMVVAADENDDFHLFATGDFARALAAQGRLKALHGNAQGSWGDSLDRAGEPQSRQTGSAAGWFDLILRRRPTATRPRTRVPKRTS